MARRRKRHSTHHRRRVSGTKGADLKLVGLAVLGAIVGSKVSSMLAKSTNATMSNLSSYASLGLGIILPLVVKNQMVRQVALGMSVYGGVDALKKLAPGIVSGPYRIPVVSGRPRLNGSVYNPGAVGRGGGYSPANNSAVSDTLKIISGIGAGALV